MRIVMYLVRSLYVFISFIDGFNDVRFCFVLFFFLVIFDHLAKKRGFWQHNVIFATEKLLSVQFS